MAEIVIFLLDCSGKKGILRAVGGGLKGGGPSREGTSL